MVAQSRLVSAVEVGLNVMSGIILAMLVWKFIIPWYFPRMAGTVTENLLITGTFTVVSIFRGYFWRRFFENGINRIVARWINRVAGGNSDKIGGNDEMFKL